MKANMYQRRVPNVEDNFLNLRHCNLNLVNTIT